MANTYCVATNWGKDFFTHTDRNDFYLSGHGGNVWVVGNNAAGVSWINRGSGVGKTKAEAQKIVDDLAEEGQAAWDALPEAEKAPTAGFEQITRPEKYILPQELTMATYKGIRGVKVETKTSDPTASEAVGSVWYNSTGDALKYAVEGGGAWASGGALQPVSVPGVNRNAAAGTLAAGLEWGGYGQPPSGALTQTQEYASSTWTTVNSLNTGRQASMGFGTQTAAVCCGGGDGDPIPSAANTETYDGTSWTEVGDMATAKHSGGAGGISTSGFCAAGNLTPSGSSQTTQKWDGTSWSNSNNTNSIHRYASGTGASSSAGLLISGTGPGQSALVEQYDGTCWSEVADVNTGRASASASGNSSTAALMIGGNEPTPIAVNGIKTEEWDNTSWTAVGNLSAGRGAGAANGSTTAAFYCAGNGLPWPTWLLITEEFEAPTYVIKTVTTS